MHFGGAQSVHSTLFYFTDGKADERYGVCSNYLEGLDQDDEIQMFVRSASGFHLPEDSSQPIILIGPGMFLPRFIIIFCHIEKKNI